MNENIERMLKGEKKSLSKIITEIENGNFFLLKEIFLYTGKTYFIGITGPPGAGKSTLINCLGNKLVEEGKKIGIIAVDPTSPFSGGALLGDRVRMTNLIDKGVFIRSMATRGSLGGLSKTTKYIALVYDAFGFDYTIIETVGVGQIEYDVADICDTVIVILVPESGNGIQTMKAGLLELADIIVVNKGDREGADRLITELKFLSELRRDKKEWECPIIKTVATKLEGVEDLINAINKHKEYLKNSGNFDKKRKKNIKIRLNELIYENISKKIETHFLKNNFTDIIDKIYNKELNLFTVADKIIQNISTNRKEVL